MRRRLDVGHDVMVERVNDDYIELFVGLGSVEAPPWESVYTCGERLVFQPETLAVRAWYRRFGREPVRLNSEPNDYIGTELEFLGGLFAMGLENGAREFALSHPVCWVGAWSSLVHEYARCCDFYPLLVETAEAIVTAAAR